MANELFTTRSGKQIPIQKITIPAEWMVPILRLQEDFVRRGEHLSLLGVVLDVMDKGIRQVRNQWKNGDLSKNRRDFAKAVAPYMTNPAKYAAEIAKLAKQYGLVDGEQVDLSDPTADEPTEEITEEPSEQELEELTSPDKA